MQPYSDSFGVLAGNLYEIYLCVFQPCGSSQPRPLASEASGAQRCILSVYDTYNSKFRVSSSTMHHSFQVKVSCL
jgi:hypothetical protein